MKTLSQSINESNIEHNSRVREELKERAVDRSTFLTRELVDYHENLYMMMLESNEFFAFTFYPRLFNRYGALDNRLWLQGSPHTYRNDSKFNIEVPFWNGTIEKSPICFLQFNVKGKAEVSWVMRSNGRHGKESIDFVNANLLPLFEKGGKFNKLVKKDKSTNDFHIFSLGTGDVESLAENFIQDTWKEMNALVSAFEKDNNVKRDKFSDIISTIDYNMFTQAVDNIERYY